MQVRRVSRLKFGHYRTATYATSFCEDADGTLWVGTYNDGLYKYERSAQRVTIYHDAAAIAGDPGAVRSVEQLDRVAASRRRGTLWISLKGQGLIAFDTKTETYKQYLPDPDEARTASRSTRCSTSGRTTRGMLWLASWGGGLVRFDPQTRGVHGVHAGRRRRPARSNHLYTLYPDPTDKKLLWLGTAKGGLVRFDTASSTATASATRTKTRRASSSDDVLDDLPRADGDVWFGTYGGGLNRLDPPTGKVERFTTGELASSRTTCVFGMPARRAGKLWLGTNGGGLIQFDPKAGTFLVFDARRRRAGQRVQPGRVHARQVGRAVLRRRRRLQRVLRPRTSRATPTCRPS